MKELLKITEIKEASAPRRPGAKTGGTGSGSPLQSCPGRLGCCVKALAGEALLVSY